MAKRIRAINAIAKGAGCRGMVAGQVSDIEGENNEYSNEMLEYIHINKTGALIISAIKAGKSKQEAAKIDQMVRLFRSAASGKKR